MKYLSACIGESPQGQQLPHNLHMSHLTRNPQGSGIVLLNKYSNTYSWYTWLYPRVTSSKTPTNTFSAELLSYWDNKLKYTNSFNTASRQNSSHKKQDGKSCFRFQKAPSLSNMLGFLLRIIRLLVKYFVAKSNWI